MAEQRRDRFTEIEDRYKGYQVYDRDYEKVGKVDDLFVDDRDDPEYIGVKMGFLGTRSTLIPFEIVRVNDGRQLIEAATDKQTVKDGPTFEDDQEISYEFEEQVHRHYGLDLPDSGEAMSSRSVETGYGPYYAGASGSTNERSSVDEEYGERTDSSDYAEQDHYLADRERASSAGPGMSMGDREGGEFVEHPPEDEGLGERESDVEDEDELRVQRSEEELRAGTREREAGKVNVRKRVRTEREQKTVPTRHEEVTVERVPASGEASETEIGEQDVSMPVTEDEVVTEKKAVKKEEIRVNKEAVQSSETVEEDVRKEEVDVEDETERGSGLDR